MPTDFAAQVQGLLVELHPVLFSLDPARRRESALAEVDDQLTDLTTRTRDLLADAGAEQAQQLRQGLDELLVLMQQARPDNFDWESFRLRLHGAYEELAEPLRKQRLSVPGARPTNYQRSFMHAMSGVVVLTMMELLLNRTGMIALAGSMTVWAWSMEFFRRRSPWLNDRLMKAFGKVAHPHETHRVNSATWYTTALFILSLGAPTIACALAVIVLGFGDPAAALIGRSWGRTRLTANRSLEGTATFVVVGAIASFIALSIFYGEWDLGSRLALSLGAGFAGAIAELFSTKLDDNFTIPLASAGAGMLVLALL